MLISITTTLEIPDGTTHYAGSLNDDPSFFKLKIINEQEHWFIYHAPSRDWLLYAHSRAPWVQDLDSSSIVTKETNHE